MPWLPGGYWFYDLMALLAGGIIAFFVTLCGVFHVLDYVGKFMELMLTLTSRWQYSDS
jgi:hypothetical protein